MACSLKDKVALITGASSGIGAATAEYFANLGCNLFLTGRKVENLLVVKSKCVAAGLKEEQVLTLAADVTEEDSMQKLVANVITQFKRLDVLVNAAGILNSGPVISAPIEQYDQIMNVNTRAIVCLTKLCLPHLIGSKGTIVNVSSINGPCSFPNVTYYCMSKAALDQFTKCLALEMAPYGVRVNSVNPGVTVTEVHKRGGMNNDQYNKFLEHSKTTHPLGRVCQAQEVAKAVAFLASDDSSFTTGHLLRVDGGRGIATPR